jgi:SPP1 family predicted phage head-tail adaptor
MRSGALRHRVKLQAPSTVAQDSFGEDDGGYEATPNLAVRDAAIEPLKGNERFVAQQLDATLTHRITLRYDPVSAGLTPAHRLVMIGSTNRVFDIRDIVDIDERNQTLEIMAMERV